MVADGPNEWSRNASQVARDLALGRYPSGIYGREPARNEMPPVFGLHSVRAEPFEAMLRFLAENGYQTLICDQYVEWMKNGRPADTRRSLLLSFDDGMGSVWSVAWPLLRKYGMTATVFLIPGIINEESSIDSPTHSTLGPTLEDVWAQRASLAEVERREESSEPLCSWAEIRQMHESGVIDFQAHTMSHNLVFTGTRATGYVTPTLLRSVHPNRLTMWERRRRAYRTSPELGAPIFPTAPRMGDAPQVCEDPELRRACVREVAENGGASFFERPDWRKRLDTVVARHRRDHGSRPQPESQEQRRREIREDLAETKAVIERHLPGKVVSHLAYPWGIGSDLAVEVSRELGYLSNHWGRVDGRVRNQRGHDPLRIARIGEDFLPLLPGTGRTSLWRVIRKKLKKNLRRLVA